MTKDDPAAPGFVAFPNNCEDRYFQELVSETRVAHKRFGQIIWRWEKPDKAANECLDTMIYCSAAAIKHGVNWISDKGWQKLEDKFEPRQPPPPPGLVKVPTMAETFAALEKPARRRSLSDFGL